MSYIYGACITNERSALFFTLPVSCAAFAWPFLYARIIENKILNTHPPYEAKWLANHRANKANTSAHIDSSLSYYVVARVVFVGRAFVRRPLSDDLTSLNARVKYVRFIDSGNSIEFYQFMLLLHVVIFSSRAIFISKEKLAPRMFGV